MQHERSALSNRLIPPFRKLIEELLMAIDGMRWACGAELRLKKNGLTQRLILTREAPCIYLQYVAYWPIAYAGQLRWSAYPRKTSKPCRMGAGVAKVSIGC